jgi:uncharacterized protein
MAIYWATLMANRIDNREALFLDTAYAIALSNEEDLHHVHALRIAEEIQTRRARLVTTHAILLEIGNALARLRVRAAAIRLLESVERDPDVEVIPLTQSLYERGLQLFRARPDKEWSLVDCISFTVMEDRGIVRALTTDQHFVQAGFQALLR